MNAANWRGRRILITGHTGFKGSWLATWLVRAGARVIGFSTPPPTRPSLFELARVADDMTSIEGDVRDLSHLRQVLAEHRPELVVHMAAQSLVPVAAEDPVETFSVNVLGTVTLLEAVRHAKGVRAVLNVTTDKCYENREWPWPYRETDALGGAEAYAGSKAAAELATAAYRARFLAPCGVAVATARAGNVVGGGDFARDRLVPDMVRALLEGRAPVIRNPAARRPWQHVLDALAGYLALLEALDGAEGASFAEGWNFGPASGASQPVSRIADLLCSAWGQGASWIQHPEPRTGETHLLALDSSKARARLDWAPKLDLERTLGWTAAWYRALHQERDLRQVTIDQIEAFEGLSAPAASDVSP